jgi:hypothetical protein
MTVGPPATDCVTLLLTSMVPSEQLVLLTVPAAESIVVVPAAVQVQVGDEANVHCVASTLTDGGRGPLVVSVHVSLVHALASSQLALPPHAWQVPLQYADKHSLFAEHAVPLDFFAVGVVPLAQYWLAVSVIVPQLAAVHAAEPRQVPDKH